MVMEQRPAVAGDNRSYYFSSSWVKICNFVLTETVFLIMLPSTKYAEYGRISTIRIIIFRVYVVFCDVFHILRNGNNMVMVVRCQSSLLVTDLGGPELTVTEDNVEIARHWL